MNLGEVLGRMSQPLELPEQPISTQSTHPWVSGVSSMPPGQQVASEREHAQNAQMYKNEYLRKLMGPIGSHAVNMSLHKPFDRMTLAARQGLKHPTNHINATYGSGGRDTVETYNYGMNSRPRNLDTIGRSNEYNNTLLAHEFRHRGLRDLSEGGNRLIDMFNAREIPQDTEAFELIKELENYFEKNPMPDMFSVGGTEQLPAGARLQFRSITNPTLEAARRQYLPMLERINEHAKQLGFGETTNPSDITNADTQFQNIRVRNAWE